jgi:hypothetical protein
VKSEEWGVKSEARSKNEKLGVRSEEYASVQALDSLPGRKMLSH